MTDHTNYAKAAERLHYWDTVRGFLMVLGVPYHAALIYNPGANWSVASPQTSMALGAFSDTVHVIRMPAFYVVAGFFAALLLQRRDARTWLKGRFIKLGLPLLVCIVTLNPLQAVMSTIGHIIIGGDAAQEANYTLNQMSGPSALWIRHLWFLTVLLYYCMIASVAVIIFPRLKNWEFSQEIGKLGVRKYLFVVAVAISAYQVVSQYLIVRSGLQSGIEKDILDIPKAFAFAPYFALGFIAERSRHVLQYSASDRWITGFLGVLFLILTLVFQDRGPHSIVVVSATLCSITSTLAIVGIAQVHFNRGSDWVRRLVGASFVIYLFHMPIVTLFGTLFISVDLPPVLEWLMITALALAGSYGLSGPITRSLWANAAFNGELPKPNHSRRPVAANGVPLHSRAGTCHEHEGQ